MSRSVAQSYTHTITFKKEFGEAKENSEWILFDNGDVMFAEIMTMRRPKSDVKVIVQNWESFPDLVSAVENEKYHKHDYVEKTIMECECGDMKNA